MTETASGQGGGARVVLYENLRTLVYVPFYLAAARGFWAREGIDVEVRLSADTTETAEGLLAGRADVSWGGPMRVMMHHDRDPACPLVCFGQVVARDPFLLVGREPNDRFRFRDLEGLRVAVASEVPTPWMTFQDDLGRAGIEPGSLDRLPDAPMAENLRRLIDGEADVIQVFEPYATMAVQSGAGHIWHRFAERGDIGYTTFYTTRAFATGSREVCLGLMRGIGAALRAVREEPVGRIAEDVAELFPALPRTVVEPAIEGYRRSGLWARDTALPASAVVRLKAALLSGGLIGRDIPYDTITDASLTEGVPP